MDDFYNWIFEPEDMQSWEFILSYFDKPLREDAYKYDFLDSACSFPRNFADFETALAWDLK